jgi:hypothetical protein
MQKKKKLRERNQKGYYLPKSICNGCCAEHMCAEFSFEWTQHMRERERYAGENSIRKLGNTLQILNVYLVTTQWTHNGSPPLPGP